MDIEFSAPQYIQTKDKKPAYHFVISLKDPVIYTSENQPTLNDLLTSTECIEFLKNFTSVFATSCSKYFPKPLVAERLGSKLTHIITTIDDKHEGTGVVQWYFIPMSMCVSGSTMEVSWRLIKTTAVISWQDDEEPQHEAIPEPETKAEETTTSQPIEEAKQDDLQEIGTDDIIPASTGDDKPEFVLGPSAAAKEKDKKKLREAKLQVELARFRAARAYEKYIAKYGDDLSDTETEAESDYE
jgi:hypothetical protein